MSFVLRGKGEFYVCWNEGVRVWHESLRVLGEWYANTVITWILKKNS